MFSVSSHSLFFLTTTWICSLGTRCPASVPIGAPLPTSAVPHWLVPAKQLSCDLCSQSRCLALSGSMWLYQGALRFRLVPNSCSLTFPVCSGCLQGEEELDFWDEPTEVQTMLIHIRCSQKQCTRYMSVLLHRDCNGAYFLILGKV